MSGRFSDLIGTLFDKFQIGIGATTAKVLKTASTGLTVRNKADSADDNLTAAKLSVSGDVFEINSDAAGSGADWKITIQRPSSGMGAAYTLTLPVDDGSPSQVLSTDGSGVLSWTTVAAGADKTVTDTTTLAFGSSTPLAMFTLPANAVVEQVQIIIDTPFTGGTGAQVSIGITGTVSKYMAANQVDLSAAAGTVFEVNPGLAANGSSENLIATYTANSASAGSARILVFYSIPS